MKFATRMQHLNVYFYEVSSAHRAMIGSVNEVK